MARHPKTPGGCPDGPLGAGRVAALEDRRRYSREIDGRNILTSPAVSPDCGLACGGATGGAPAEDLQGVPDVGEAVLGGLLLGPLLHRGALHLDGPAAGPADQV